MVYKNSRGLTLVEVLISCVITVIVMMYGLTFFLSSWRMERDIEKENKSLQATYNTIDRFLNEKGFSYFHDVVGVGNSTTTVTKIFYGERDIKNEEIKVEIEQIVHAFTDIHTEDERWVLPVTLIVKFNTGNENDNDNNIEKTINYYVGNAKNYDYDSHFFYINDETYKHNYIHQIVYR